MSELRWHPLVGQWVITATERQERTFLPPKDFCPLCPTKPGAFPSEVSEADYDVVTFENKFPSLRPNPPVPAIAGTDFEPVAPAGGVCEVVCYTPNHESTLAEQPIRRIEHLIQVWTDRFQVLGDRPEVKYVFQFENKGKEIGVTMFHPHGQIYAYPFIPPIIERELDQARKHRAETGRNLLLDIVAGEVADGRRIIAQNDSFAAYIPFFARYPYEVHITAKRPGTTSFSEFTVADRINLAVILKQILAAYDKLWDFSLPYIMSIHQRPTDGQDYADIYQFHIEFYPPYRTKDKLKYLAGSEAGVGAYINDTLAEEKAEDLRNALAKAKIF
ncbi:MAG: galactose-1-phosphate uridylyltransferase [Capsulimonadaceae bacterium]|nr:galactose-1-phosphate uridylyltransferase [Capsulimonadaceae bacterium]